MSIYVEPHPAVAGVARYHIAADTASGDHVGEFNRVVDRIRQFRGLGMWRVAYWDRGPNAAYTSRARSRFYKWKYETNGFSIVEASGVATAFRACALDEPYLPVPEPLASLPGGRPDRLTILAAKLDPQWFSDSDKEWALVYQGVSWKIPFGRCGLWIVAKRCFAITHGFDMTTDLPEIQITGPELDRKHELPPYSTLQFPSQ